MVLKSSSLLIILLFPQISFSEIIDGQLTVNGAVRTYHLFIPDHSDLNKKLPLVIMLHGGGGTGEQMIRFTHFNDLAEQDTFLVVYPDGLHRGWNDHRIGDKLPHEQDDVKFISMLIDEIVAHHAADPKRVFATGISNGAIFSLFLAQELSEKILAIAPVCGSIPANYASTYHINQPLSILMINGTDDPLVKYEGGPVLSKRSHRGDVISTDSMVYLLTKRYHCMAPVRRQEFADVNLKDRCHAEKYIYPTCSATQIILIKIIGGGHTWPGGFQYLPKRVVGNVCKDFNAASEIWNFFKSLPVRE
ncbi:MAG TPA: PHB depolymerase family esterase [Chitinophagales bacterium]|nr:PHB depolymerase family esterase [Chitinophagales bacterium]